jgi:hypothetical protein
VKVAEEDPQHATAISQAGAAKVGALRDEPSKDSWCEIAEAAKLDPVEIALEGAEVILVVQERRVSEATLIAQVDEERTGAARKWLARPAGPGASPTKPGTTRRSICSTGLRASLATFFRAMDVPHPPPRSRTQLVTNGSRWAGSSFNEVAPWERANSPKCRSRGTRWNTLRAAYPCVLSHSTYCSMASAIHEERISSTVFGRT